MFVIWFIVPQDFSNSTCSYTLLLIHPQNRAEKTARLVHCKKYCKVGALQGWLLKL
jgi:hypothetical protein